VLASSSSSSSSSFDVLFAYPSGLLPSLGLAAASATAPTGSYHGTKSILGETIDATVKIDDTTHMDLTISGVATINCANEGYSFDGSSSITLPGMSTAGDCVHDAIASQSGVSISAISYSQSADSIIVTARYTFITIHITLTKSSAAGLLGATRNTETAQERERWFNEFVAFHGKTYSSAQERTERRAIFEENLDIITKRNADGELGHHFINKFADMSHEEFRATHMGYKPKTNVTGRVLADIKPADRSQISSVDWRTHTPKILTPVKDQGQCGSCWAFSATEQIETDVAMATGHLYTLSPQQIVSCDKTDDGCNGGNTETAYDYVAAHGLELNSAYPYTSGTSGRTGTCRSSGSGQVSIGSYSTVSGRASQESRMLTQIQTSPISVCVDASSWQTYTRGVLGRSCGTSLDHCVQAVGYNANQGYWIVRNSWNTDWGVDGYIYVKEGIDACGIAKDATIVTGASVTTVEA